jgi:hypothetical protein
MTNLTAPVYTAEHANAWTGIVGPGCTRTTSKSWKEFFSRKGAKVQRKSFRKRGSASRLCAFVGEMLFLSD